jgi:hypothetical protein
MHAGWLWRYKFGGKLILKTDLREMGWEGVDLIHLAQDEDSGDLLSQL